jgi:hypothetical protein
MKINNKIKTLFFGTLIIGAGTFALVSSNWAEDDIYQGPPVSLYRSSAPKILDNASFNKLASKSLKLQAVSGKRVGNALRVDSKDDPTQVFEQRTDGSILFNASLKKYADAFKPKLPSEREVDNIAQQYLKANDLLPADPSEMKVGHIGGLRASKAGTNETIDKMRTVTYIREIDGLPVVGPGSKIVVNIGDNSEVAGLVHRWKAIDKAPSSKRTLKVTELRGEQDAKNELTKRVKADWGQNAKVRVEDSKIAYFDSNDGFIQPVYVFESKITPDAAFDPTGKSPEDQAYLGFVPAMKQAAESIDSEEMPPANQGVKESKFDAAKDGLRKDKAEGEDGGNGGNQQPPRVPRNPRLPRGK